MYVSKANLSSQSESSDGHGRLVYFNEIIENFNDHRHYFISMTVLLRYDKCNDALYTILLLKI